MCKNDQAKTESVNPRRLPLYDCHKQVRALKIKKVEQNADNSVDLLFEHKDYAPITIAGDAAKKFTGDPDLGYYVEYKDGYVSWSPTKAFENGYTPIVRVKTTMRFSFADALSQLKDGSRIRRTGWNDKMFLELQKPDEKSKMTLPYICMRTAQGDLVPWLASQPDLLSNDWEIVK